MAREINLHRRGRSLKNLSPTMTNESKYKKDVDLCNKIDVILINCCVLIYHIYPASSKVRHIV